MTSQRSRLAIGAGLAALIVCSATVGAGAAGLIGSKDIRDDSIRSVDIKNGTIAGRDVKDGSLTTDDVAGGLKSRVGPDRVVAWSGTYDGNGANDGETPLVTSSDTIPANSLTRGLQLTVTKTSSACADNLSVIARVHSVQPGQELVIASGMVSPNPPGSYGSTYEAVTPLTTDVPLEIVAECYDGNVPSFDFTVTFSITQLDDAPTGTFE